METTLNIIQIVLAILLIISVLLQQRGSGLGIAFGGEGNIYRSRRGIEKLLFYSTIVFAALFCVTVAVTVFLTQ